MIVAAMEVQEIFIGKLRDHLGISPGFHTISCIRKQRVHDLSLQNVIGRGKSSLHLVIYHTVIDQVVLRLFQNVAPALLTEDLFFVVDIWKKHCVHIHLHQVAKILEIAAGHGIHGLIRISHSI